MSMENKNASALDQARPNTNNTDTTVNRDPTAKSILTASGPKYIVTKKFRDKGNFMKEFTIGEDVSHFEKVRLQHLISIGYVQQVEDGME